MSGTARISCMSKKIELDGQWAISMSASVSLREELEEMGMFAAAV